MISRNAEGNLTIYDDSAFPGLVGHALTIIYFSFSVDFWRDLCLGLSRVLVCSSFADSIESNGVCH